MVEFKRGQQVVHCRDGLAVITDETMVSDKEYFIVKTIRGGGENIYVLVNNTNNLIRPIMNEKDAKEVIDYMKSVEAEFISNTKQRRDQYKRRLLSGNVRDLAYLSRQLYFYNFYNEQGQLVKLGPTDVQMLKDAETILFDELSISFSVERERIADYVKQLLA